MRPLVHASSISRSFGPTSVLHDATFDLFEGEKIALVGPNGAGKTTIFRLLAGRIKPDTGEFELRPDLRIAYLPQVPEAPAEQRVAETMAAPTEAVRRLERELAEVEGWMADPKSWEGPDAQDRMARYGEVQAQLAEERSKARVTKSPLMSELGLRHDILDARWGELSGGERSKVALCKVLAQARETDLLLLDEPTNHMDIPTVEFIEDYLMGLDGAVVLAAHDRYLLDNIATRIFELNARTVLAYEGNFSAYLAQKDALAKALAARRRREVKEYERQLAIIEELKRRNKFDGQIASRQTRMVRAYRDIPALRKPAHGGFQLLFETERVPRRALWFDRVAKRFNGTTLFRDASFEMAGGEKIGLIGPNGCGKSTLIKLITGELQPDEGEVGVAQTARVGYFHQHHETLDPDLQLVDEIRSLRNPPPRDEWTRGLLGRFNFSGDEVFKRVKELSGGERARLALAKFVADRHNVLLLDEPTNHLDLEGQEIVASALADYEGSVLVVSHDRSFLDQICDRIAVIDHRRLKLFQGNFSEARTSKAMAEFTGSGVKARYRVLHAFVDEARDARYQKGDVIELTGLETQGFRRLIRMAEAQASVERAD